MLVQLSHKQIKEKLPKWKFYKVAENQCLGTGVSSSLLKLVFGKLILVSILHDCIDCHYKILYVLRVREIVSAFLGKTEFKNHCEKSEEWSETTKMRFISVKHCFQGGTITHTDTEQGVTGQTTELQRSQGW